MDYEIQMHLRNSENYLRSPDNIQPNELAKYFAAYTDLGVNDFITSLVQRYFYFNLNHPAHLRYIHLLDGLIKYSFPLPQSFVQMFTECFQMAVQNGRKNTQQELKILRKLWTPILNDSIIQQLRIEVYKRTKIDIDQQLREQSKKFLHQHFEKNLMLNQQDIYQILYRKQKIRIPFITKQILSPIPPQTQFLESQLQQGKPTKKPKLSEDTEAESKCISKREQALLIHARLKSMSSFNCKQCGKYFQTKTGLQKHYAQHFQQRMAKFKKNQAQQLLKKINVSKNGVRRQKDVKQWSNQADLSDKSTKQNLIISKGQQFKLNKRCSFCRCQFDVDILDDVFVYKNAIKVNLIDGTQSQGQIDIMHYQCYHTLIIPIQ